MAYNHSWHNAMPINLDATFLEYSFAWLLAACFLVVIIFQHKEIRKRRFGRGNLTKGPDCRESPNCAERPSCTGGLSNALEGCNLPACQITGNVIDWQNSAFKKFTGGTVIQNVQQFDVAYSANLADILLEYSHLKRRELLMKTSPDQEDWRHFSLVSWCPKTGKKSLLNSRIALFLEQTQIRERTNLRAAFEGQIVKLCQDSSLELEKIFSHGNNLPTGSLGPNIVGNLLRISAFINRFEKNSSPEIHPEPIDLTKLVRNVIQDYHDDDRMKRLHIISTLPKQAMAVGNRAHFQIALEAFFESLLSQLQDSHQLKLHLDTLPKQIVLEFYLPDLVLPDSEAEHIFDFGNLPEDIAAHGWSRHPLETNSLWKVQLALCRRVLLKYRSSLSAHSSREVGTIYRITCPAER